MFILLKLFTDIVYTDSKIMLMAFRLFFLCLSLPMFFPICDMTFTSIS